MSSKQARDTLAHWLEKRRGNGWLAKNRDYTHDPDFANKRQKLLKTPDYNNHGFVRDKTAEHWSRFARLIDSYATPWRGYSLFIQSLGHDWRLNPMSDR